MKPRPPNNQPALRRLMRTLLIGLLAVLPAACSIRPAAGLPGPAALAHAMSFSHQIEMQRQAQQGGSVLSFITVENRELHFVLTTLTGQPLLEARHDHTGYRELSRDAQLPARFHTDYLLRDLCWALWPSALLEPDLKRIGMSIREDGQQRWLLEKNQTVLEVQRHGELLHLKNFRFGYEMVLTPVDDTASTNGMDNMMPEAAP